MPELRGSDVFWDGPYRIDAESYGVQFDKSDALKHDDAPGYTPVTDVFTRDSLFVPLVNSAYIMYSQDSTLICIDRMS